MSTYRYRQFRKVLKTTPFKGKFMPYNWGKLPNKLPFAWMPYAEMFEEFSREIANTINELTNYTHDLTAWRDVMTPLDDNGRADVLVQFVTPLATLALNLPYVIRSRFIFATAHLCHQVNRVKAKTTWKDNLPLDEEIYFATADTCGAPWKSYSKLKLALERISGKDYQANTGHFRHLYNHRFSPRIELGQTQRVTRHVDKGTGAVSYGFGGRDPLPMTVVVNLLEEQVERCYKAFTLFQKLVAEHEKVIVASLPTPWPPTT